MAFWKLFHARSPSNKKIWRGPLELEHESNFMFKVNYYVHFNWHLLLTLTSIGKRSLPVWNRFDLYLSGNTLNRLVFQKFKYKQICTFFVPGNFESGENSINDQNQGMFLYGENFAPLSDQNFANFANFLSRKDSRREWRMIWKLSLAFMRSNCIYDTWCIVCSQ